MVLEIRPNCERCDADLPPSSQEARICSYECTYCANCAEGVLANTCPNCGGDLQRRPIRPTKEWRPGLSVVLQPASDKRVHLKRSEDDVGDFIVRLKDIPPQER